MPMTTMNILPTHSTSSTLSTTITSFTTMNYYSKYSPYSECHSIGTSQYECLCRKGFKVVSVEVDKKPNGDHILREYCEDIDECAEGLCKGDKKICINIVGSYKCYCDKGYKFDNTSTKCVHVCDDSECRNGECVQVGDDGYACVCQQGYYGVLCDQQSKSKCYQILSWIWAFEMSHKLLLIISNHKFL